MPPILKLSNYTHSLHVYLHNPTQKEPVTAVQSTYSMAQYCNYGTKRRLVDWLIFLWIFGNNDDRLWLCSWSTDTSFGQKGHCCQAGQCRRWANMIYFRSLILRTKISRKYGRNAIWHSAYKELLPWTELGLLRGILLLKQRLPLNSLEAFWPFQHTSYSESLPLWATSPAYATKSECSN